MTLHHRPQHRKQHSQVIRSLHELGSLTSPPTPASDTVAAAGVQDVVLQSLDDNSAHVVVTLRAEEATVSTVAPTNFGTASAAPIPQPVPEPQKEDTMTTSAAPAAPQADTTNAASGAAAPTAADALAAFMAERFNSVTADAAATKSRVDALEKELGKIKAAATPTRKGKLFQKTVEGVAFTTGAALMAAAIAGGKILWERYQGDLAGQ